MESLFVKILLIFAFSTQICFSKPASSTLDDRDAVGNHPFDLLIFTQRWPITACYEWREHNKDHICGLPSPNIVWTIHGIWPTKINTIGPAFCNKTAVFDVSQLSSIESQLEEHWLNVEANKPTDSLWEHEWLKHGTCAAEMIEQLNTELKYFGQGLSWLEKYSVGSGFAAGGNILPGFNYSLATLNKALFGYYGKDLAIECYHDSKTHLQILNEIRICFNKQLELTDCDGIVGLERQGTNSGGGAIISNCNAAHPILYPDVVPKEYAMEHNEVQPKATYYSVVYEVFSQSNDGEESEGPQVDDEFVEVILV
ncbi:ribonuclease Oy [Anopheles aquasalis]|uniref:ribonuclease Oy n=1 Tax=Anopheles aquasalis TaxID=42839 RepID=UPI00215B0FCE|nr:ribonuclease Oy [Anopheles aquasalis]